jgi:ABC-type Mn2+/Zn2+ transport system permease subunit
MRVGVLARVAALCEAGMISVFALLVWLPAIVAAPRVRLPWTAFWISWAIGAAAWVVAANIRARSTVLREEAVAVR